MLKRVSLFLIIFLGFSVVSYAAQEKGFVLAGNKDSFVKLSGRLSQAMLSVYDEKKLHTAFGNNSVSDTRMTLLGKNTFDDDLYVTGKIEIAIVNNRLDNVSQKDYTPKPKDKDFLDKLSRYEIIYLRVADAIINSKKYGAFSIGHGPTASDGTAEVDFSGTGLSGEGCNPLGLGHSFAFVDKDTNMLSDAIIFNSFNNLDGLSRKSRARYDTPVFHGLRLSGSASTDNQKTIFDGGITYNHDCPFAKFGLALGVSEKAGTKTDAKGPSFDGSSSVLFNNGISVTTAGGFVKPKMANEGRRYPFYAFGKLGYQQDICSMGKTYFSASYGRYDNFSKNYDKGHTAGAAVVQNVSKINTDVFIKYRFVKLDRVGKRLGNLHVFAAGLKISF